MTEFEAIGKVFQELGLSSFFSPLLATVIVFSLLKKYILTGTGVFFRGIMSEYLRQNNERIALETKIDIKLGTLTDSLETFVNQLMEWEKRNSERITEFKRELSERITNIEIVLSDKVFCEINELKSNFVRHSDSFEDAMNDGKISTGQTIANMDTEAFRKLRKQQQEAV